MNLKNLIKNKISNFINEKPLKYISKLTTHEKILLNCYKEFYLRMIYINCLENFPKI